MSLTIIGPEGSTLDIVKARAQVDAVTNTDMEARNEDGFVWSLPFDAVDPTGADDVFLYIQNTESDLNMHIRRFHVSSTVAGMVEAIRVTGTAVGGSAATLVNFNANFPLKTPDGVFETGVDITGLVDEGKYRFQQLKVADQTYEVTFHHDVILGKNGAFALNWVPATGILSGCVYFFLHK